AEVQAGVSCLLADVSPALVQLRYHIAYRIQSGQVDSLAWHVPSGYVLESVQAPQLAAFRFEPGENGSRTMLIEFLRPQTEDFSLAATFAVATDQHEKRVSLPLLDPLRGEDGRGTKVGLRLHQIALRQPFGFRVSVSSAVADQPLKARRVDDFLKEWNAADSLPQQAF